MADINGIIQTVVAGILTGGASAGTTLLATFKKVKDRVSDLEARVGTNTTDPKTGLYLTIEILSDSIRRIKKEMEGWQDDPPEWAIRAARKSSVTMESQHDVEERFQKRFDAVARELKRIRDTLEEQDEALSKTQPGSKSAYISRSEYEEDSKRRAAEVAKIKENLASSNTWLRGVLTALGYIDSEPDALPKPPMIKKRNER